MLVDVLSWLVESSDTARNVLVRGIAAGFTAFLIGLLLGPAVLRLLVRLNARARVKSDSATLDELSREKVGTPIMGGLLVVPALLLSLLLWGNLRNSYVQLAALGATGFCLIGSIDDFIKMHYPTARGMTSVTKLGLQSLVAAALAVALWAVIRGRSGEAPDNPLLMLTVPFTGWELNLAGGGGIPFVLFSTFIMVGTSNGVNLADGLDGLAPGCVVIACGALAVIAFAVGRPDFSDYLSVLYVRGAQEMVVVAAALGGATLAFLWFNAYPAQVFLGDTGSLPLGGLLGYIAIVAKQELVLAIIGGVFVVETLSVIAQVGSFKLRGRRVLRCAPIHHHFQFGGMHESKIVVRFWIAGLACGAAGLLTLRFG